MRNSSTGRFAIGILVVLLVAGGVIWWALQQGSLPTPPQGAGNTGTTKAKPNLVVTTNDDGTMETNPVVAVNTPPDAGDKPEEDEKPAPPTWEDTLDGILLGDENEDAKADKIIALMQYAPADAQEELSQHAVNMTQDTHYDGLSNLLMNVSTSTNVAEVLLNDLLNRDNKLKLTMLLKVFETPDHPMKENAHDMLQLFVQEDYGTDNKKWEDAVAEWLKDNEPEPQAQATPVDAPATQ
jgi:hypothetical protein